MGYEQNYTQQKMRAANQSLSEDLESSSEIPDELIKTYLSVKSTKKLIQLIRKEVIMARRKRYIKGRVYYTNDSILVNVKPKKRRVVTINNNPNRVHVKRILSANKGRNSIHGKPIEIYPDIPKQSVVEDRTFRKTRGGKPIKTSNMRKSATRFNKWDRKKIGIK